MLRETDEALLANWRAAETETERNRIAEVLFERHYRRVGLWCLRWTGNRDAAQDLAQEIFLKVHRNLGSFQGDSRFTTWLYTVCRNHCINAGMASRAQELVEIDEMLYSRLASTDPGPDAQYAQQQKVDEARQLLEQHLDEREREVMLLHYVEGWSLPMVTRALHLDNASGAKAFLVSAHRKLKTAVDRLRRRQTGGSGERDTA